MILLLGFLFFYSFPLFLFEFWFFGRSFWQTNETNEPNKNEDWQHQIIIKKTQPKNAFKRPSICRRATIAGTTIFDFGHQDRVTK